MPTPARKVKTNTHGTGIRSRVFVNWPTRSDIVCTRLELYSRRYDTLLCLLVDLIRGCTKAGLDLSLIFGVSMEERLDFQLVHPATQGESEPSLEPKVNTGEPASQEFQELGD